MDTGSLGNITIGVMPKKGEEERFKRSRWKNSNESCPAHLLIESTWRGDFHVQSTCWALETNGRTDPFPGLKACCRFHL
jgi:hypothetical protein